MENDRDAYVRSHLGSRDACLDGLLREALLSHRLVPMQVDDNSARLLQILTQLKRPMRAIEIGTYFGYSAIHIARGLPPGGRLTTIEISQEFASVAQRNLNVCGVADRVELIVADAVEYLQSLEPNSVEMIFIDGEKKNYPLYLKLCVPLLAYGGILIADDAFADGNFDHEPDADVAAAVNGIRKYTHYVCRSPKLFSAFIGTEHGMIVSCRQTDRCDAEFDRRLGSKELHQ